MIKELKYYDYVYIKRGLMRMYVLETILGLLNGKDNCKFSPSDIKGMTTEHVSRCLGDLSKELTLSCQLTEKIDGFVWNFHKPTLSQVTNALNLARTGGTCTDWNPE